MNITVTVSSSTSRTLRTLIRWDNPIAVRDGYSATARGDADGNPQGQFSMAPVYVTDAAGAWVGSWSHNDNATKLTTTELHKIGALQIPDVASVDDKMRWALWHGDGEWGGVLAGKYDSDWRNATDVRMIAAVYAGQVVEVIGHTIRTIVFGGHTETAGLSEIRTYQPHEWTPAAVQLVTTVTKDNVYGENPRGKVRLPIYFGNRRAWVLDRWLL